MALFASRSEGTVVDVKNASLKVKEYTDTADEVFEGELIIKGKLN